MHSKVLENLITYIKESYNQEIITEIPTAALLTGINMPDHSAQFTTLSKKIKMNMSPHVATLPGSDCQNMKSLVENLVNQLINQDTYLDTSLEVIL